MHMNRIWDTTVRIAAQRAGAPQRSKPIQRCLGGDTVDGPCGPPPQDFAGAPQYLDGAEDEVLREQRRTQA